MPGIDESADSGLDMDAASASVAAGLGFGTDEEPKNEPVEEGAEEREEATQPEPKAVAEKPKDAVAKTDAPAARQPPSSWAKETHELWAKISPEAQAQIEHREKQMLDGLGAYKADATYGKTLREAIAPYQGIIAQQGVSETHAVQFLLNAHAKLSTLPAEERRAFFTDIGKKYGIDLVPAPAGDAPPVDPTVKALEEKYNRLESVLTAREQEALSQRREAVAKQVEAFWNDPAHPYANEVGDEIARLAGVGYSLEEAYEKAVWGNPVIREKELARVQTETDAKLKEKLKTEGAAARRATAANVRSRDTSRAPTELLGTMDETLKSTLSDIRGRV